MAITISTLSNANVYINGSAFAGQAEEVTLPDLKPKMTEMKALSQMGVIEVTTGLEKMGVKIKWNSVNPEVLASSADFFNADSIMIRANLTTWQNGSRLSDVPCVAFVKGLNKNLPAIGIKHQDTPDVEQEFSVSYYRLEINGAVVFEVDFYANVYIVDGEDMLADLRANLGL
jgi:uncharacterized protein